jgi:peroxiredoxin
MKNLYQLPDDLPVPVDDGACDHLTDSQIPSVALDSTSGASIDLSKVDGISVIFFYPMHGHPDALPMTGWNDIPGARGCTPQACSFRDSYTKLAKLGVKIFGVSSQPLSEQQEASERLELPYILLNDSELRLSKAMKLPTFEYDSSTFIKRITLICENGVIKKTLYPVFPPDKNVYDVLDWVEGRYQ